MTTPNLGASPIDAFLDKLESIRDDLAARLDGLDRVIDDLRDRYPARPSVFMLEVDGHRWFGDGYMVVRDVWPGDYTAKEDVNADLGSLLARWEAIVNPVAVTRRGHGEYLGHLVELSHGAWIDAQRHAELTIGRGFVAMASDRLGPVVFRNQAGELTAVIMPVVVRDGDLTIEVES